MSEAHAIQRLGDSFKAAVQMEGRGMVINDEGYAVLGTVQAGNKGAGLDHVVIELFVHAPPDVFQHLKEVRRGLGRGRHAAREAGVDMVMPAAEGGHDETARAVQYGVFRRTLRRRVGVERIPPNGPSSTLIVVALALNVSGSIHVALRRYRLIVGSFGNRECDG